MKKVRRTLMTFVGVALAAAFASGNGGGYSFGVTFTGGIAPFQASGTEKIRIVHEDLTVDLRRTEAIVIVRYTMRNLSDGVSRVAFGFPVEARKSNDFEPEEDEEPSLAARDTPEARRTALLKAVRQLKGYTVTAGGRPVPARFLVEPFATGQVKAFPGCEVLKGIAGWMVSQVTFAPAEDLPVEIRYAADHEGEGEFVSDDDQASPLSFHYRLSTGAVWNGPIESGIVTLHADGIPPSEVEVVRPLERFRRVGDRWVWEFRELEPTLADDITVNAVPGYFHTYREDHALEPPGRYYLKRLGKVAEGHQLFKATASSVLRPQAGHTYGPENLTRSAPGSPWCEGVPGPGLGEYIQAVPRTPKELVAVGLYTGYQDYDRPRLFEFNARPARVEVLLNDEVRSSATIGDKEGEQLIPVVGYTKPVLKVRIMIEDVYPGSRYEDTCITRLILYDLLPGQVDLGHAR